MGIPITIDPSVDETLRGLIHFLFASEMSEMSGIAIADMINENDMYKRDSLMCCWIRKILIQNMTGTRLYIQPRFELESFLDAAVIGCVNGFQFNKTNFDLVSSVSKILRKEFVVVL
jgi:hypothetical protein